ncbi:hypothetical protein LTR27_008358 [Elasticomyces elasticus]|nr:hypothetical protein LTR27_008358 [Elasticomyces elasticus]
MLAQEIEAIVKPIKLSIEQAANKIVVKVGSQDLNKTLQQGLLSVEQACNKVVTKTGSQDARGTQQPKVDIRAQILDNARILWPMLEMKACMSGARNSLRDLPRMAVVVVGSGTTIYAAVVRLAPAPRQHDRDESHSYVFMRSVDTDSVEKAVQKLLELTMVVLNQEAGENLRIDPKEQKTMSRAKAITTDGWTWLLNSELELKSGNGTQLDVHA